MSEVHLSGGIRKPASPQLRSEIAILAVLPEQRYLNPKRRGNNGRVITT